MWQYKWSPFPICTQIPLREEEIIIVRYLGTNYIFNYNYSPVAQTMAIVINSELGSLITFTVLHTL